MMGDLQSVSLPLPTQIVFISPSLLSCQLEYVCVYKTKEYKTAFRASYNVQVVNMYNLRKIIYGEQLL